VAEPAATLAHGGANEKQRGEHESKLRTVDYAPALAENYVGLPLER
jgi:hypothetical protein